MKSIHWQELQKRSVGTALSNLPRRRRAILHDNKEIDFTTNTPVQSCAELQYDSKSISISSGTFTALERSADLSIRATNIVSLTHRSLKAMQNKDVWGEKEDNQFTDLLNAHDLAVEAQMFANSQLSANLMLTKRAAVLQKASLSRDVKSACWRSPHEPGSIFGQSATSSVQQHHSSTPKIIKGSSLVPALI